MPNRRAQSVLRRGNWSANFPLPSAGTQSPNGTHAPTVVDAAGATWMLGSVFPSTGYFQTLKDGVAVQSPGADEYITWNNKTYIRTPAGFYEITGAGATFFGMNDPAESANLTRGPAIITGAGNAYTLGSATTGGLVTLKNGVAYPVSQPGGALEFYYLAPNAYYLNDVGVWFIDNGALWQQTTDPTIQISQPVAPTVVLTASASTPNAPGVVTLTATTTKDATRSVTKVEFFKDGSPTPFATVTTGTNGVYTTTDTALAAGTYNYTAKVTDNGMPTPLTGTSSISSATINASGGTASPDGTHSTTTINDGTHDWTFDGSHQTLRDGIAVPVSSPGAGFVYLFYQGNVYLQNSPNWYKWDANPAVESWGFIGTTDPSTPVTPPPPPSGGTESPDRTRALTVTDYLGRVWTRRSSDGAVLIDGVARSTTGTCIDFFYWRHKVWRFTSNGVDCWFDASSVLGAWVPVHAPGLDPQWMEYFNYPTVRTPNASMSAHGTRSSTGPIIDAFGASWTCSGGSVFRDGVNKGLGVELTFMNYTVVIKKSNGRYFEYSDYPSASPMGFALNGETDSSYCFVGLIDPLEVEAGTHNYGTLSPGLRNTVAESLIPTRPEIYVYQATDLASLSNLGLQPTSYDGHHTYTTWTDRGNVAAIVVAGATSQASDMLNVRRFLPAPLSSLWFHASIKPRADLFTGMGEPGIKLSEIASTNAVTTILSLRPWMSKPIRCLPNHCLLRLYTYDHDHFAGGGAVGAATNIATTGYAKLGDYCGIDIQIVPNTFSGNTPNADGIYRMFANSKKILEITNRRIISSPADRFDEMRVENFQGGNGCPISPLMDVSSVAIHIENGPVGVSSVQLGPLVVTTPSRPAYIDAMTIGTAAVITSNTFASQVGGSNLQVAFSGNANIEELGIARCVWTGPGGHSIGYENPTIGVDVRAASPAFSILDAGSSPAEISFQSSQQGIRSDVPYYRDARYCGAHMYGFTKNFKGMNQVVRTYASKTVQVDSLVPGVGGFNGGPQTFDLGTNTVLADGAQTVGRFPAGAGEALDSAFSCCDYDPRNGDIYIGGASGRALKYTRSSNTWALFGSAVNFSNGASYIDVRRNRRFFMFGARPWNAPNPDELNFKIKFQDLATGVAGSYIYLPNISNSNIYTTHSGLSKPLGYEHDGCVHDVDRDIYLYFMNSTFNESGGDKTHIFSVLPDPPYTVTWLQAIPSAGSSLTGTPYYWSELGLITFFVGNFDQRLYGIRTR